MGNCFGICNSKINQAKNDIIISKELDTRSYYEQNDIKKIIFIQNYFRNFLKKIHLKKKLKFTSKILDNNYKKTTQPQSDKDIKYSYESTSKIMNSSKKQKNNDSINKSKYIIYDELPTVNELLIPTVNTPLIENKIFNDDPFRKKNNNKNTDINDPRNGPMDGIRRKCPKIQEDQSSYEGEWKNGKRDGFGFLYWGNKSKFMGNFEDDKVFGFGKLWHDEGDIYTGYWKEFQADGIGIYKTKKGSCFKGEWKNDRQNGFGMENWPKGSSFSGEYIDGIKNGIGIMSFGSKAKYKGEFQEGIISGIGTFYFEDKRKYEGQWRNNKMHGFGIIVWPGGDIFEGEFKDDKKCGFGVFYNQNKIFMGNWKNNKLEGDVIIIDEDKIKRQFWENGRPIRVLDDEYKTLFEKYVNIIKKEQKKKKK